MYFHSMLTLAYTYFLFLQKIHISWLLCCCVFRRNVVMKKQQSFSFWSFFAEINRFDWLVPPGLTPFCYFEYRMYSWIHWIDCAHYSASFFLILTKGLRCIHWESSCNCLLIVRPSFTWQNSVLTKIYAYHELGKWLEHFGIEASLHSQNMIDVITMERE